MDPNTKINWRAGLMITMTCVIVFYYPILPILECIFKFDLNSDFPPKLWDILWVVLGGGAVGKSVETSIQHWKAPEMAAQTTAAADMLAPPIPEETRSIKKPRKSYYKKKVKVDATKVESTGKRDSKLPPKTPGV